MNDMDLLNDFRASVPETPVSPEAEARFHDALHITKRRGRLSRGPGFSRQVRLTLLAPVAAGIAAAVAVALLPARGTTPAANLTVRLLADRAATAALRQPSVSPTQWVYREVRYKMNQPPRLSQGPNAGTVNIWQPADGTPSGGRTLPLIGMLMTPPADQIGYAELRSLPTAPAALERYLADRPGYLPWADHSMKAFYAIESILAQYVVQPRLAAELYRALAYIPGVTVDANARDVAGRPGVAFALSGGSISEIILNPRTDTFAGMEGRFGVATAFSPEGNDATVAWVTYRVAIIREALVSANGVRP